MTRQHRSPILVGQGMPTMLGAVDTAKRDGGVLEDLLQDLVHSCPEALPLSEIDPIFADAISVCRELNTPAGRIDNLLITPTGLPILVECKLWRNAESRRKVVGQILDYAQWLARWSYSDLAREVSKSLGAAGQEDQLLGAVKTKHPTIDASAFQDAVSLNLRRGRFMLAIVGDGIRQDIESLGEYLRQHTGLHFTFGLIEMPFFQLPDKTHIVTPRILAHSYSLVREVVQVPEGHLVRDLQDSDESEAEIDPETKSFGDERQSFWRGFFDRLTLDDKAQPLPPPPRAGYVALSMPVPSSWVTVYRDKHRHTVGLFLSASRKPAAEYAMEAVVSAFDEISDALGPEAEIITRDDRQTVALKKRFENLDDTAQRAQAYEWLVDRTNRFINEVRPRVESAGRDFAENTFGT